MRLKIVPMSQGSSTKQVLSECLLNGQTMVIASIFFLNLVFMMTQAYALVYIIFNVQDQFLVHNFVLQIAKLGSERLRHLPAKPTPGGSGNQGIPQGSQPGLKYPWFQP